MKRLIAFIIVVFIMTLSLTGCSRPVYVRGNRYQGFEFAQDLNLKVEANKLLFDINDVTLDFFYSLYSLDDHNLNQLKDIHWYASYGEHESHLEAVYAIYISNNKELLLEEDESGALVDYQNGVNAKLIKFISFEEAFDTDYGYITLTNPFLKINYNHNEKLTIPAELFNSQSDYVYIHLISLVYNVSNDKYYNEKLFYIPNISTLDIKYKLLRDKTIVALEK